MDHPLVFRVALMAYVVSCWVCGERGSERRTSQGASCGYWECTACAVTWVPYAPLLRFVEWPDRNSYGDHYINHAKEHVPCP